MGDYIEKRKPLVFKGGGINFCFFENYFSFLIRIRMTK